MALRRMNEKEIARWGRIRAKGRKPFIARETITFALIPAVSAIVLQSLEFLLRGKFASRDYTVTLVTCVALGLWRFFKAHHEWMLQEERYKASAVSTALA